MSPLLFVLAADLLQSIMNDMLARGILSLPLPSNNHDYPVVQYAYDTLMVLPAVDSQLLALKEMLAIFTESTGLKVNFSKSCMIPIIIDADEATRLAALLGCHIGIMPFTYWDCLWELLGNLFRSSCP